MKEMKLPEGWKVEKLDTLFLDKFTGDWGSSDEENKGIFVIRTTNFTNNGKLNLDGVVTRCIDNKVIKRKKLQFGDIILEKSGGSDNQPVGRVIYFDKTDGIYICNNFTHVLRVNKKKAVPKYVMYFLLDVHKKGITKYFQNKTTGIRNLQMKRYLGLDIVLPPQEIQKKIVKALEKAEEILKKRKEVINLLDELVKSRFIEVFGDPVTNPRDWEVKLLGEVCDMKAGKNIKACDISEINTGTLYPCYGGNGLRGYVEKYSHEGNIPLIGRQGALCGNVNYARGRFYATEHAVVTQPKVKINNYWLYYILNELDLNRFSIGAAQPGLTIGKLNRVKIPIAPLDMQNQFADFVKQVDKLKFN
jgi:type I restriction enzyme S subunit